MFSERLFRGRQQGPTWPRATSERAVIVNTYRSLSTISESQRVHRPSTPGLGHRDSFTADKLSGACALVSRNGPEKGSVAKST